MLRVTPTFWGLPVVGALAAALLSGCSGRAPLGSVSPQAVTDTLWYISVRARDALGRDTRRLADSLEFGLVVSRIRSDGNILAGDIDVSQVDSVRLTASAFAAALRHRARRTPGGDSLAVLIVHGFGTSLREAWSYAAEARVRSRSGAPWVAFCWPSNGAGVAWPRPGQILTRAYREDSAAATASLSGFSEAARVLISSLGSNHLVVVAHSMGSQVVGSALAEDTLLRAVLAEGRLRGLAFIAPDIETQYFNGLVIPAIRPLTQRIVIYASSNDRVLQLSRAINRTGRAGLIRDETVSFSGVEIVDTTEGASAENPAHRVVGTHHAIKRASAVLFDLHIIFGGYAADCRATLGTGELQSRGSWKLSAATPPPLSALAACARLTSP